MVLSPVKVAKKLSTGEGLAMLVSNVTPRDQAIVMSLTVRDIKKGNATHDFVVFLMHVLVNALTRKNINIKKRFKGFYIFVSNIWKGKINRAYRAFLSLSLLRANVVKCLVITRDVHMDMLSNAPQRL